MMISFLCILSASLICSSLLQPFHVTSNAVGTFLTTVSIRRGAPSVNSEIVGEYHKGETVNYDQTVASESRTWISYIGGSGNRNYCCAIDVNGSRYIDGPADLIGNNTGTGSWKTDNWEFLKLPINYSFGISDAALLTGFKNSGGGKRVISKYSFTDQNIADSIQIIRRSGVSPEWFLAYAANEGGGSNGSGWINHYGNSANTGTATAMAQKDCDWIVSQSQKAASCAWYDVGNPVKFVPQSVQDDGNAKAASLPAGSIGRVYLAGTAAATWATFYPNGLLKEYNGVQDYGDPIKGCRTLISSW